MSEIELYESSWKLAQRVNATPFVPKAMQGKPEHVLACVLYGRELGLGPMQALNSIHVIEGRAAASPELMRALVASAGHRIDITENTNEACSMKGIRVDTGAEATVRWTVEDAKLAGLTGKDNWRKYPRAMLAARCTSELCRLLFPDVIAGLSYTPEELQSISNGAVEAPVEQIEEAVIVASHGSPDREAGESDEKDAMSALVSDSQADPIQMIMEAFPGTEIIEDDEVELVDSQSVEDRRKEIKTWGAWPRVRAIAIPLARANGLQVPGNIDDLINDHTLYTMVAKEMRK